MVSRFYSDSRVDWASQFNSLTPDPSTSTSMKEDLAQLVYYNAEMCSTDDGEVGEGIAIAVSGNTDIDAYYGFSMVATWDPSSTVEVHEAAGFFHAEGTTSADFKVSGEGTLDSSQKLGGDVITKTFGKRGAAGHSIYHGWANFLVYMQKGIRLKTSGGDSSAVTFSGYMEAKAVADWGKRTINFPGDPDAQSVKDTVVSRGDSQMAPIGSGSADGAVTIANTIQLGLKVDLFFTRPWASAVGGPLPDMSITQVLTSVFSFEASDNSVCLDTIIALENVCTMTDGAYVGWGDNYDHVYVDQLNHVGSKECFSGSAKKKKRQNNTGGGSNNNGLPSLQELLHEDTYDSMTPEINCDACGSCTFNVQIKDCCGCVWLPPE